MSKQVPEEKKSHGKNALGWDEQMEVLREKLLGNKTFGKIRGKLSIGLPDYLLAFINQSQSPTAAIGMWDEFASEIRILLNMAAGFKRDGMDSAQDELLQALKTPGYYLPGENPQFTLEKTTKVTLLMFDPEKTMEIVKFALENGSEKLEFFRDYFFFIDSFEDEVGGYTRIPGHIKQLSRYSKLDLPSLISSFWKFLKPFEQKQKEGYLINHLQEAARHFMGHSNGGFGHEISLLYALYVLKKFVIAKVIPTKCLCDGGQLKPLQLQMAGVREYPDLSFCSLPHGSQLFEDDKLVVPFDVQDKSNCFAFWFQADQGKVLSNFDRKVQSQVATWQFHIPTQIWEKKGQQLHFGIHPEVEHSVWQGEFSNYCSKTPSHGWGAIFLPNSQPTPRYQVYFDGVKKPDDNAPFRVIFA